LERIGAATATTGHSCRLLAVCIAGERRLGRKRTNRTL